MPLESPPQVLKVCPIILALLIFDLILRPAHAEKGNWREMGKHLKQHFHHRPEHRRHEHAPNDVPQQGRMNVQVVRSVSDWSHGVLTEHSIQNACKWSVSVKLGWRS